MVDREQNAELRPGDDRPVVIEVRDLVAQYPGNPEPARKGVSFDIYENEVVAIMGGRGSGKSTLLRRIVAVDRAGGG